MKANELIQYFNDTFGLNKWPEFYEVDAETYANWCQFIFNHAINGSLVEIMSFGYLLKMVSVGKHGGPMCKGVELILGVKE